MKDFRITRHCVERLIERAPHTTKIWPELQSWHKNQSPKQLRTVFDALLAQSSENKSMINDTGRMASYYWDKYGFDSDFKFFECQAHKIQLVFVKKRSEDRFSLVTVVPFHGVEKRNKWRKIARLEDRQTAHTLREYDQNSDAVQTTCQSLTAASESQMLVQLASQAPPLLTELEVKTALRRCVSARVSVCMGKMTSSGAFLHRACLGDTRYEFIFFANEPFATSIEVLKKY